MQERKKGKKEGNKEIRNGRAKGCEEGRKKKVGKEKGRKK